MVHRRGVRGVFPLSGILREEIDLNQLRERFLTVILRTMQPYSVSLWTLISYEQLEQSETLETVEIADDDPLIAYALSHPCVLEIDRLHLNSPILQVLKLRTVELLLPLANQGELIGLFTLGPHLKGEAYTREERTLLDTLAPPGRTSPACSADGARAAEAGP